MKPGEPSKADISNKSQDTSIIEEDTGTEDTETQMREKTVTISRKKQIIIEKMMKQTYLTKK